VALAMIAISAGVGGTKGLIGALVGVAIVTVFFGISVLVVGRAARVSPQAMMVAALGTFLVKILALAVMVEQFSGTTAFNARLFGFTAIVCIVAWSLAQAVTSARQKILYVEPTGKQ
jgi:ATP synthase protein I